jgi:hypothetical protein
LIAVDLIFEPDLSGFRRSQKQLKRFFKPRKRGSKTVAAHDPRRERLGYGKHLRPLAIGFFAVSAR